jgi:hypothetical protein
MADLSTSSSILVLRVDQSVEIHSKESVAACSPDSAFDDRHLEGEREKK